MNRKDLRALILVGPTWENPVPDPLAVLHLDKQLCIQILVKCIKQLEKMFKGQLNFKAESRKQKS